MASNKSDIRRGVIYLIAAIAVGLAVSAAQSWAVRHPGFDDFTCGSVHFSTPNDSTIIAAATNYRIRYIHIIQNGSAGDSLVLHMIRALNRNDDDATLRRDKEFPLIRGADPTPYYNVGCDLDTLILRGEYAATTDATYYIGLEYLGMDSGAGAAP